MLQPLCHSTNSTVCSGTDTYTLVRREECTNCVVTVGLRTVLLTDVYCLCYIHTVSYHLGEQKDLTFCVSVWQSTPLHHCRLYHLECKGKGCVRTVCYSSPTCFFRTAESTFWSQGSQELLPGVKFFGVPSRSGFVTATC